MTVGIGQELLKPLLRVFEVFDYMDMILELDSTFPILWVKQKKEKRIGFIWYFKQYFKI